MDTVVRLRPDKTTFTSTFPMCNAAAAMSKKWIGYCLLMFVGILAGCVTTVTNLTSTTQARNANNLYLIEYQWDTTQQTIRHDSIQPFVVVGFDTYEMRPTRRMTNRWEALVPVPADKSVVTYKFKVDYEFSRFGNPGKASKTSPEYKLYIK